MYDDTAKCMTEQEHGLATSNDLGVTDGVGNYFMLGDHLWKLLSAKADN
jgi:hypothetical protein